MYLKSSPMAFYGGTFDPIHYGHLFSAISVAKLFHLDKVFFLPNNVPVHKPKPLATKKQRIKMIDLAISEIKSNVLSLDKREIKRSSPSYIIRTLEKIRIECGLDLPIYFVLGTDSFLQLSKWHRNSELSLFCHLVVCYRPGYEQDEKNNLYNSFFLNFKKTEHPSILQNSPSGSIFFAPTIRLSISSTEIRDRYSKNKNCDNLLPSSVQEYIREKKIYL